MGPELPFFRMKKPVGGESQQMRIHFFLSLFILGFATAPLAMGADVSSGDVEIVMRRAPTPKTLAERTFLARRAVAQARELPPPRAASASDDDLAASTLHFANVPRVYVNAATLGACEARYRDFMKRLAASKVAVLQAIRCQRVIAPVQTDDNPALPYQGIIDFIK